MSKPSGALVPDILADQAHRQRIRLLIAIGVASILLWQTLVGSLLLYPFTVLATWFHEMGHGIAIMLTGSRFERLLIFPDGSGVALSMRPADASRLTNALISASGPLGPAIAGSLLIIASQTEKPTRAALTVVGSALVISTVIWVRTLTGWLILPALGIAILALAWRGTAAQRQFGIQLLGVQACISVWQQFGYLFSSGASVGGELHRSDTGAIADAVLLPYWFWGAAISAVIILLLWWSFAVAFRR
ncbi:MAG: M50 family peptidase [Sphingomonadales bacterium]|nr:MAG: M50 family peptidase [Sphingomonadales bacterium]